LQSKFAHTIFLWVDIEDEAELVDPMEVENFPTLLIANAHHAVFFGTLTPHIETLARMIEMHQSDSTAALPADDDVSALVDRLWKKARAS
jgi:hypothetical protein